MHGDHLAGAQAEARHPAGHAHAAADFGAAFALGITLNTAFVLLEALFGLWSGSTALIQPRPSQRLQVVDRLPALQT